VCLSAVFLIRGILFDKHKEIINKFDQITNWIYHEKN